MKTKNSLTGMRFSTFLRLLTIAFFLVIATIFSNNFNKKQIKRSSEKQELQNQIDSLKIVVNSIDLFTPEICKDYLYKLKFAHPEIIYKVAVIETGNFKSRCFKAYNNLWGLQYSDKNILNFDTWRDCCKWQRLREFNNNVDKMTENQYINWLKKYQYNGVYNIK